MEFLLKYRRILYFNTFLIFWIYSYRSRNAIINLKILIFLINPLNSYKYWDLIFKFNWFINMSEIVFRRLPVDTHLYQPGFEIVSLVLSNPRTKGIQEMNVWYYHHLEVEPHIYKIRYSDIWLEILLWFLQR